MTINLGFSTTSPSSTDIEATVPCRNVGEVIKNLEEDTAHGYVFISITEGEITGFIQGKKGTVLKFLNDTQRNNPFTSHLRLASPGWGEK